jgi:hypothetical protein
MDFGLYISVGYVRGERGGGMRGRDLNNRSNTLKTLSAYSTVVGRIENKKLKRLMYYLN